MPRYGIKTSSPVTATADGVDLTDLWAEVRSGLTVANDLRTTAKARYSAPKAVAHEPVPQGVNVAEFEQATEYGEPVALRNAVDYALMGYSFRWLDLMQTVTWRYFTDHSADEYRALADSAIAGDILGTQRAVYGAMFNSAERRNSAGDRVYGLWNGDGSVPTEHNGQTFTGGETQYFTTGSAEPDGSDFTVAVNKVNGKGYGPASGAQLIIEVNPLDAKFVRRARAAVAGDYDFVEGVAAPARFEGVPLVGQRAAADYNGTPVIGSYGPALVIESELIPRGYVLCAASYGPNSSRNPVGFREHARPELRGLKVIPGKTPDYPLIDSFWAHGYGSGVRHRGAAAIMQITAATVYTPPAAYATGTY